MNAITLYKIYETTRDNKAPDTTIGLAMYKAEHPEAKISWDEDKELRGFMARHGQALAKAFPDPEAFAKAVAVGEAKDKETVEG